MTGKLTQTGTLPVIVTPRNPVGTPIEVTGSWDKDAGTLTIDPLMPTTAAQPYDTIKNSYDYLPDSTSEKVSSGWTFGRTRQWQLEFDVEHPSRDDNAEKTFTLTMKLDGACQGVETSRELVAQGDFTVQGVELIIKSIGQTNPCPCADNVITVTLKASLPISVACEPVITITGLTGSQTPDNEEFAIYEPTGVLPAVASWTRSSGTMVIPLSTNLANQSTLVFSFALRNQAAPQASPAIFVSIGETFVPTPVMMDRDGESTPHSGETIDVAAGDAQPMSIWAIRFVEKKIGQSTPFPGCVNTLTVTLSFNCPIDPVTCPTYVSISNLLDNATFAHTSALVTPEQQVHSLQNPTGKLSLTGMQHLVVSQTTSESWWAPGLCGESRMSSNDWCEACEPANGQCTVGCSPGFGYWEDGYIDCLLHDRDSSLVGTTLSVAADHQYGGKNFSAQINIKDGRECVNVTNHGYGYSSGGQLKQNLGVFSVNRRLTLWLAKKLHSNASHVFQFQITNPVKQQRSPEVVIESKIG